MANQNPLRYLLLSVSVLSALSLTVVSCRKTSADSLPPVLEFRHNPVSSEKGQQFISVTASGPWTLSMDYGSGPPGWAELGTSEGSGNSSNIRFLYEANDSQQERTLTLSVKASGGSSSVVFTQKGKSGEDVKGRYGDRLARQGWLELPATDKDDGLEFFSHSMSIGSVKTRNYSYYYDYDHFVAVWVAYPLNSWLIGPNIGRTDAWGFDPLLPAELQQNVLRSYGSGGYSRGHQVASADRLGSYERNASTFYGTNMTPQNYDFNGGIWAKLEGKVRDISKASDTLYVVTGCVLGDDPKSIYDRGGHRVAVPEAYFKALLFYSSGGSSYARFNGFSGTAFYMPHDGGISGGDYRDYAITIKALEDKTGLEFFANLPSRVGEETTQKIKTQGPDWCL